MAVRHAKKLEEYVSEWPELRDQPEILRQLLEAECLTRAILDAVPAPEELWQRFPAFAHQIDMAAIAAEAQLGRGSVCGAAGPPSSADTPGRRPEDTPSRAVSVPPLEVGRNFGRYEIRRWLGAGGMGTVYVAYHPELDCEK